MLFHGFRVAQGVEIRKSLKLHALLMCVCVREREGGRESVSECVCERERQRQRDRYRKRERGVLFKLYPHFLSPRSPVNIYYRK